MKNDLRRILLGTAVIGVLFSACSKDDDKKEENEEEVITTMVVKFTPTSGGAAIQFKYDDPDGPGGTAPVKEMITLAANKSYDVELLLLNKTVNPADTISAEVEEEADAHRFYFEPSAGSNITVSGLDTDDNNIPLGLNSTWTTTAAATGKIKITLRHYPGNPPGKALADLVNSSKSGTDMEVEFDTKVQ
jgi:hypothetical protein